MVVGIELLVKHFKRGNINLEMYIIFMEKKEGVSLRLVRKVWVELSELPVLMDQ